MSTSWSDLSWHLSPVWNEGKSLQVTQQWGPTTLTVEPLLNGQHVHTGIDVGMNVGSALYAARDGKVAYIGYGLLALVSASACDWYVHIDRVATGLAVGMGVSRSELVAYSGAKVPAGGFLTGPHLHFEVQPVAAALLGHYDANGRWLVPFGALNNPASSVDPVPVLQGLFGPAQGELDMAIADDIYAATLEAQSAAAGGFIVSKGRPLDIDPRTGKIAPVGTDYPTPLWWAIQQRFAGIDSAIAKLAGAVPATSPDTQAILAQIADLKAHPAVVTDPAAVAKLTSIEAFLNAPRPVA